MALSEIDRNLLERCLKKKPRAWEDFVDRFMGLVVHVVKHTALSRNIKIVPEDRDDLCSHVFLAIVDNDFAVLQNFRGQSSLATYLTVIARRIVVHELLSRKLIGRLPDNPDEYVEELADPAPPVEQRLSNLEEVTRMLSGLDVTEAEVVKLFHLEGKSYREISFHTGIPENSIGPILSRAKEKLRRAGFKAASPTR